MNDAQIEAAIDRRVQARLATDRDYLWAEKAEEQAWAERKIELQEELALLQSIAVRTPEQTRRADEVYVALHEHCSEPRS